MHLAISISSYKNHEANEKMHCIVYTREKVIVEEIIGAGQRQRGDDFEG